MRRVITGVMCGLVSAWLLRRYVGVEIVCESDARSRAHAVDPPAPFAFPVWYREWIVAQACVRSRYDC